MNKALIVVDVQKFFLHDAPNDLVTKIVANMKNGAYSAIAFTVFKNTPDSNFIHSLKWPKCNSEEDIALPNDFKPYVTANNVFTRATYSGFNTTKLNNYLNNHGIDSVLLCGVDTDACVLATAFSAFDSGYLVDVNFELTYSGGDLEKEAQAIMKRSLIAKDYP